MEQQLHFRKIITSDNKIQFIEGPIVITIDQFSYTHMKHWIINPETAKAQFLYPGKIYLITNTNRIATVEDWYNEELLPKFQMFTLLSIKNEV